MSARHPQSDGDGRLVSIVCEVVAAEHGLTVAAVVGRNQSDHILRARHVALYLCTEVRAGNYAQVAQRFSGRGAGSVTGPVCNIRREAVTNRVLAADLERMRGECLARYARLEAVPCPSE